MSQAFRLGSDKRDFPNAQMPRVRSERQLSIFNAPAAVRATAALEGHRSEKIGEREGFEPPGTVPRTLGFEAPLSPPSLATTDGKRRSFKATGYRFKDCYSTKTPAVLGQNSNRCGTLAFD